MTVPVVCSQCGTRVGVEKCLFGGQIYATSDCPGQGNHKPPEIIVEKGFFGLIERVTSRYPETNTSSVKINFVGPRIKILLWLAIVLTNERGIFVNGKWCSWDSSFGFLGLEQKSFDSEVK